MKSNAERQREFREKRRTGPDAARKIAFFVPPTVADRLALLAQQRQTTQTALVSLLILEAR